MKHRTTTSDSSSCREQLRRRNAWQRLGMVLLVMMTALFAAPTEAGAYTVTLLPGEGSGSPIVLDSENANDNVGVVTNLGDVPHGKFYTYNGNLEFRIPGCPDTFTSPGDGKVFLGWNNGLWNASNYISITENVTLTAYWDNVEFDNRYNTYCNLTFRVTSTSPNEVEIKKVDITRYDYNMVIPSTVTYSGTEYAVTRIAESVFVNGQKLSSVVIPASVREIGKKAFYGCSNLTSADISATVIGELAFASCQNLATATLHNGAIFGPGAFPNSTTLQLATHQAGDAYWATFYSENKDIVFDETTTVYWAECNGTTLNLHKINERIAEGGTAVIVKSMQEYPEMSFTGDVCADMNTIENYNSLRGLSERTLRNNLEGFNPAEEAIYVFDIKNGEVGFYEYTGEYVPAGQTFLVADKTDGAQSFTFAYDEQSVVNLENPTVSSFLSEVTYTEDVSSQVANYIGTSTERLDHPNCVSITVPENNATITVTVSLNDDYSNPETFTFAAGTTLCKIYNLVPQTIYYYKVEAGDEILKQGQFTTEGHLRMIMTETGFNIRDLGGWATIDEDNRTVYGKLFRGGELNCGHEVSAANLAELRRLGIGAELDLRRDADCNNNPPTASALGDDVDYLYMNQPYDDLTLSSTTNKNNIKRAFEFVLEMLRNDKAVYFHCRIGADRTGMYALVFGGLSGMTFDQLCKDYELTSFSEAGLRQWDSDGVNTLKTNLNYIKAQPGKTLQMKFYNYMHREVGIEAIDLMDYIDIMTDGEPSIRNADPAFNNEDGEYISSLNDITAVCALGSALVNGAKAQLSDGTTTTDVDMSIDGIIITFAGPDLEPDKEYTLTIPAEAIEKGGTWNSDGLELHFHTSAKVSITTWAGLKAACKAGGTVKLTADVTRNAEEDEDKTIVINNTVTTVDLNGHTIRGYDDNSSEHYNNYSIFSVTTGGSLTITDGSEGGAIANTWGADAIQIDDNGSATMTGGTIRDTTTGVSITGNGSFMMTGGTITDNGTGVEISSTDATFTVSGNVNITGNEDGYDVCLRADGQPIHIGDDGLAATARIGVKCAYPLNEGTLKPLTSGLNGKGTKSNFVLNKTDDPDDDDYRDYYYTIVTTDDGELALIRPTKGGSNTTGGIYFYNENYNEKAIIDASSTETLSIPNNNEVYGFTYDRTFNPGKASTVVLPFECNPYYDIEGGTLYRFDGVKKENGEWVAEMSEVDNTYPLSANTPCLFVPDEGSTAMLFPGIHSVSLNTQDGNVTHSTENEGWVFQGTYEALKWTAGSSDGKTKIARKVDGNEVVDDEEGYYYGFAATSGKATDGETDVEVGQFVQVASGASIKPTRAYLKFNGAANARGAAAAQELPKTISVRLVKHSELTGISDNNRETITNNRYYDLQGRRVNVPVSVPVKKGLYIVGGKKVVIK